MRNYATSSKSHNDLQRAATSHSDPQRPLQKSHSVTILVKFELSFSLYTLYFIYNNKVIICFCGPFL